MAQPAARETDLYAPIKMHLERQGYVVKGEVGAADIVALRDDEDPVIVELKSGFSLALFHQGIVRQAISDAVYVAVPRGTGRPFAKSLKNNIGLCRRLGLGADHRPAARWICRGSSGPGPVPASAIGETQNRIAEGIQ